MGLRAHVWMTEGRSSAPVEGELTLEGHALVFRADCGHEELRLGIDDVDAVRRDGGATLELDLGGAGPARGRAVRVRPPPGPPGRGARLLARPRRDGPTGRGLRRARP